MPLGVGANDKVGQDTARPAASTRLPTVRIGAVRLRRPQPYVTRQVPLDGDLADGKELVKRLDAHTRSGGQLRVHRRTDREPERLDEAIEEGDQDAGDLRIAADDGQEEFVSTAAGMAVPATGMPRDGTRTTVRHRRSGCRAGKPDPPHATCPLAGDRCPQLSGGRGRWR